VRALLIGFNYSRARLIACKASQEGLQALNTGCVQRTSEVHLLQARDCCVTQLNVTIVFAIFHSCVTAMQCLWISLLTRDKYF